MCKTDRFPYRNQEIRTNERRRRFCVICSPTTYHLEDIAVAVEFKLAWVLVFKALHGAPQYLADDCQLVTAAGRRQLRSSDALTCVIQCTRTRLGHRSLRTHLFLNWVRSLVTLAFSAPYKCSYLLTYLLTSGCTVWSRRRPLQHWRPTRLTLLDVRILYTISVFASSFPVPRTRTNLRGRGFSVNGPARWNSPPPALRTRDILLGISLKTHSSFPLMLSADGSLLHWRICAL